MIKLIVSLITRKQFLIKKGIDWEVYGKYSFIELDYNDDLPLGGPWEN